MKKDSIKVTGFSIILTDCGYVCAGSVKLGDRTEVISCLKNSIKECVNDFEAEVILRFEQPFELDAVNDNNFSEN